MTSLFTCLIIALVLMVGIAIVTTLLVETYTSLNSANNKIEYWKELHDKMLADREMYKRKFEHFFNEYTKNKNVLEEVQRTLEELQRLIGLK